MRRYDNLIQSEFHWIKEYPSTWKLGRIKSNTYVKARIGWQGLRSDEFILNSDWYCVTGTDFKNGSIDWENCYCVEEDRYNQDKKIQLKIDDLLITKDGTIGKIALIKDLPKKSTLNSGVFVTRPLMKSYNVDYFYWVLSSNVFRDFIDYHKNGSTILHLYQNVFERFVFLIPSNNEQQAIANYLDAKTKAIDKKVSLLEQKIEAYKKLKRTLINQTITKGLDKNVSLKDSCISWIGQIPQHWEVKRLRDIAKIQTGNTPLTSDKLNYSESGIPWVKSNNLYDLYPTYSTDEFISEYGKKSIRLIKKDSVMVCCIGSIGKMGVAGVDLCTNQQINSITFKNIIKPEFGKYLIFISKDEHIRNSTGNVLAILNTDNQSRIKFAYTPNLSEQEEIAQYLDQKTAIIDAIVNNIGKQIETLKQLRKTLINDVVTGKIRVIK